MRFGKVQGKYWKMGSFETGEVYGVIEPLVGKKFRTRAGREAAHNFLDEMERCG